MSNSVGSVTSAPASLAVILPPGITTPPQSQTVASGGTANFNVTATGTGPLAYFWLKNNAVLANSTTVSGANSAALTLTAVSATNAASYSVIITNSAGSITSAPAVLSVVSAPAITGSPAAQTVAVGANVSFGVTAAGSAPLYYFWQKNGSPLTDGGNVSGSATATLNLSGVTTNDAAGYSVIVSNSLGTATSSTAALAVLVPAAIVSSPFSATVIAGTNLTLTVSAAGSPTLVYQWWKNNVKLSGATTASLSLANVSISDAGTYFATVSNSVGGAASASATLTVLAPPQITAQPSGATVAVGSNTVFAVSVTGTAPLSFQWSKDGNPLTDAGEFSGSLSNVLTVTGVSTNDAGNYSVAISNTAGSTNSASATLAVIVPPAIITPPSPVAAIAGTNVSFTVTAEGTAPFTYQWRKNGVNISGATSSTLTLNTISTASAANYSVIVANAAGSATSADATLTVLLPPAITAQPASLITAPGATAAFTVTATGSVPLSFQWFKNGGPVTDGGNITGSQSNVLTISSITTNDVATYYAVATNPYGTATSSNAQLVINSAPFILTSPASQNAVRSSNVVFNVTVVGSTPLAYQWLKNGAKISGATAATLSLTGVTTNNDGNYSVVVTNLYGRTTSSVAALKVFVPPAFTLQASNRWTKAGAITIFRANVTGTAPLNLQWFKDGIALGNGGEFSGSESNVLTITGTTTNDAGAYTLTAANFAGSITSSNAVLQVVVPPIIISRPVDQLVAISNTATFNLVAAGERLHFQWLKGVAKITGATNATFSIAAVKTNDAAAYSVIVTNFAGSVTSTPATLTVVLPPAFTMEATNRTVRPGVTTVFRAAVKGTAPFHFQWLKNGVALADSGNVFGSQSNVLVLAGVSTNDTARYTLSVTNLAAQIVSTNAALIVKTRSSGAGGTDNLKYGGNVSSTTKTVTIAPPLLQISPAGANGVTLQFQTSANATFVIQATPDLLNWTDVSTNSADTNGLFQYTGPAGPTQQFYRVHTTR